MSEPFFFTQEKTLGKKESISEDEPFFFTQESWISPVGFSDAPVGAYLDNCGRRSPAGENLAGCCRRLNRPAGKKLDSEAIETTGKKETTRERKKKENPRKEKTISVMKTLRIKRYFC